MKKDKCPNWKQFLPIYGVYQSFKDNRNGKPSLTNIDHPITMLIYSYCQGITIGVTIAYSYSLLAGVDLARVGLEKLLGP